MFPSTRVTSAPADPVPVGQELSYTDPLPCTAFPLRLCNATSGFVTSYLLISFSCLMYVNLFATYIYISPSGTSDSLVLIRR